MNEKKNHMINPIRNPRRVGLTDTVYPKGQMSQSPLLKRISSRNSEESGTKEIMFSISNTH